MVEVNAVSPWPIALTGGEFIGAAVTLQWHYWAMHATLMVGLIAVPTAFGK